MAVATAAAIAAGISVAAGTAKTIMGASQAKRAREKLNRFQRQELKNVAEGMRVSTLGADLKTQESQRRFSTAVDALRSGGVRGVVGGLGAQEMLIQNEQAAIAAELDRQQVAIEQIRAQDEAAIRGMTEQRQSFDMNLLLGEKAAGKQMVAAGIGEMTSGLTFAAMNMTGEKGLVGGDLKYAGGLGLGPGTTGSSANVPGVYQGYSAPAPSPGYQIPYQQYTFQNYLGEN